MAIEYGEGLTDAEKRQQQAMFDELPKNLKEMLSRSGTKVWVGTRADNTPGWDEFSRDTGLKTDSKIADGRDVGTLSFYLASRNELFISVRHPGGSVNVYTHELGHAIDFQMIGQRGGVARVEWPAGSGNMHDVRIISDDPRWEDLHAKYIRTNTDINSYFRGGPSGTDNASGRRELFAEGFAIYNKYGYGALVGWTQSADAAKQMIDIWKEYGVIK